MIYKSLKKYLANIFGNSFSDENILRYLVKKKCMPIDSVDSFLLFRSNPEKFLSELRKEKHSICLHLYDFTERQEILDSIIKLSSKY